jgi:predicted Rossmann fold nucleotide-binding protein DprA/Smf involved in DNA uptake
MCALRSSPRAGMNRRWGKLHLYSGKPSCRPTKKKIFALLKADESTPIDEIVERLEPALSSSEIFAALFELELAGKVKQLPGKNFMKTF